MSSHMEVFGGDLDPMGSARRRLIFKRTDRLALEPE